MSAYLGIDIGTSACKVAAFDDAGAMVAFATGEYDLLTDADGAAELDAAEVLRVCRDAVRDVAKQGPPIAALGITSQGEAFTAVTQDGRLLNRAMVSSDTRSRSYVEAGIPGLDPAHLYQITGHTPHPMFTLYKLAWLRDNRPDIWRAADQFLCFEDLVQWRLGLDPAMGWPLAARTMLFNIRQGRWDPDILAALGLGADRLARPLASGTVAGVVPSAIAADWGLPEGVPVVTGGHDQACGALGAGAIEPGSAMYATGTVECITPAFAEPVFSDRLMQHNLCTYHHAAPNRYATVAFSLTGGNALKWFRNEFGQEEVRAAAAGGANAYDRLIELAGTEPSPLLCLPYLTPSGTPYFDADTPGAFLGFRLTTTRGDMVRALLEGIAFEMRLNLALLEEAGYPVHTLYAVGGGARSREWTQLKADVIGRPIHTLDVTEAGCRGVAMLAGAAVTERPLAPMAQAWVKITDSVQPHAAHAAVYDRRFAAYQQGYQAVRQVPAFGIPGVS